MARIVKAALLQTDWTGDKESMIDKHEAAAREAAKQGAQVMCFQELFYGPYFCQEQDPKYFSYTEPIPDGPTTKRFQGDPILTSILLKMQTPGEDRTNLRLTDNEWRVLQSTDITHSAFLYGTCL